VYYDGQFNDSRLAVAVACTAAAAGAAVVNHAEARSLLTDPATGRVVGARVRDALGGGEVEVHARVVINATGPFADQIRRARALPAC
jgi:glycerol-3-phosphate dehydrogenase